MCRCDGNIYGSHQLFETNLEHLFGGELHLRNLEDVIRKEHCEGEACQKWFNAKEIGSRIPGDHVTTPLIEWHFVVKPDLKAFGEMQPWNPIEVLKPPKKLNWWPFVKTAARNDPEEMKKIWPLEECEDGHHQLARWPLMRIDKNEELEREMDDVYRTPQEAHAQWNQTQCRCSQRCETIYFRPTCVSLRGS